MADSFVSLSGHILPHQWEPLPEIPVHIDHTVDRRYFARVLLVEFEPGVAIGLRFITLQAGLSALFGRRVDLATAGFLSPHSRSRVVREAVPLYEAA